MLFLLSLCIRLSCASAYAMPLLSLRVCFCCAKLLLFLYARK